MAPFGIHPQLLLDTHDVGRFRLCHVLLHKNALLPWFILVPETDCSDLFDLSDEQRSLLMNEATLVAVFIKEVLGYSKINFASIGNVVPQLHLHVVGRKPDDPCWPAAVWGHLQQTEEYSAAELRRLTDLLARCSTVRAAGQ